MNLMGTSPAATHAHETKTLPKQETDADYSYARLWFARGISTCLVSALPLCDPGRGYCWPQIAPAPGTGPQSDEGRPCYSYYYTTHHITGQRCCSWQPFRQNCTQKSEHKFILFCITLTIFIFSTPFKCVFSGK